MTRLYLKKLQKIFILIVEFKSLNLINISDIYQNKLLCIKLDAKYSRLYNPIRIFKSGERALQKSWYFTDINEKTLYNSRYSKKKLKTQTNLLQILKPRFPNLDLKVEFQNSELRYLFKSQNSEPKTKTLHSITKR